ncbi:hypothetical protein DMC25_04635 [Caulobacter sp. D4A]|uniref:hypothetical protein n=1 Tax=unclassified Caulobacter TaxID=2648921 RepID=UPI000D73719D|nr:MULTISPECIES: hypothetical protein [unclassified Caulobacter]PXA89206.1 hypothetical protein DMC18_17505 [Caulobacter sp. D5]PXA92612.1 hypothetical protein DMC25_04635 [Caulobacter sp. D4A]
MILSARRKLSPVRKPDRLTRSLRALERTASTSRVLNLLAIAADSHKRPEYSQHPLFRNRVLNNSLIVKHRLRADDLFLFDEARPTATKIIIPFERSDLSLGGQSFFVGQRGWIDLLREACNDPTDMTRDLATLRMIDMLPSLDPFLLREHLRRHGMIVAPCYFALSPGDLEQMQGFVTVEISRLIDLAYRDSGRVNGAAAARLVEALLSTDVDERLEPLRETLVLEGESFREGVFSWKGFLYYKWMLTRLWPQLTATAGEIGQMIITGAREAETARYVDDARKRLQHGVVVERASILRTLKVYDDAFEDLIDNGKPQAFREFLLRAPEMFLSLGEKVGVISHIASFWRYRFPEGQPAIVDVEEAVDILQDFDSGLSASLSI